MVADAGYGVVTEFRDGLDQRQEHYIVGLLGEEVVLTEPPRWVPHVPKSDAWSADHAGVPGRGRAAPGGDPHAGRVVGADDGLLA